VLAAVEEHDGPGVRVEDVHRLRRACHDDPPARRQHGIALGARSTLLAWLRPLGLRAAPRVRLATIEDDADARPRERLLKTAARLRFGAGHDDQQGRRRLFVHGKPSC